MVTFGAPGLFGKLPSAGDFVRLRAGDAAGSALARWLEEGTEAAAHGGARLGAAPVRFLFRPAGGTRGLLGVLAGSGDRVGRRFPLALFVPVEGLTLAAAFPALPAAARPFLEGCEALLAEAGALSISDLSARLPPPPAAGDLAREVTSGPRAAAAAPAHEVLNRLFGDRAAEQAAYAFHCLRSACQPVRGREPVGAAVVLDCPVQEDIDRFLWLELARRALGWGVAPNFFWADGPAARLLLALGTPPPSILPALWDPARRDGKLWPLTTAAPAAVAAARKALGAATVRLLDSTSATVAELATHLQP